MRLIGFLVFALTWTSCALANDINLSTSSKDGNTVFYLQAGAYNLEKDAKQRQKKLNELTQEPIEIKNLADKSLYLV